MKKYITGTALILTIAVFLAGCTGTDVVLKYAPSSLDAILQAQPAILKDNTLESHYYNLSADNETTLRISHDYNLTGEEDLVIVTPLKPFMDAGLDASDMGKGYTTDDEWLYVTGSYGEGTGEKDDPTEAIFESVAFDRSNLSYHEQLDHYGIQLANGKFEFAKDYNVNDKDMVFILAAQPLAELGTDIRNIDGWIFMTMENPDGRTLDVLVKPYDL